MNWTGGGLQRHMNSSGSLPNRQAKQFVIAKRRRRTKLPSTLLSDRQNAGSDNTAIEGEVTSLKCQSVEIAARSSSHKRQPGVPDEREAAAVKRASKRLLETEDWAGLKRVFDIDALRVHKSHDHGTTSKKHFIRPRQGDYHALPLTRVFCRGALPSEDISVRVGTAAIGPSSIVPTRSKVFKSRIRPERATQCRQRRVYHEKSAVEISSPSSVNKGIPNVSKQMNASGSAPTTVSAHLHNQSGADAAQIVDDEHYDSVPRSLRAPSSSSAKVWHQQQDRQQMEHHEECSSSSGLFIDQAAVVSSSCSHLSDAPSEGLDLFACTPTKSPYVQDERHVTASNAIGSHKSSSVFRASYSPCSTKLIMNDDATYRDTVARCATTLPASRTTTAQRKSPTDEERWMRFIFGDEGPSTKAGFDNSDKSTSQLHDRDIDDLSLAAFVSSSSHGADGVTNDGNFETRGAGWRSTAGVAGDSRTRVVAVVSTSAASSSVGA